MRVPPLIPVVVLVVDCVAFAIETCFASDSYGQRRSSWVHRVDTGDYWCEYLRRYRFFSFCAC